MRKKSNKPNYENWPRINVSIAQIFLDPENIRLQLEDNISQSAIIDDLFLNEQTMQILESMVSYGIFPDETPVVIKKGKNYTVIEGNRRIAALKVLTRPEILQKKESFVKELRKSIERLPESIEVLVAPNRESVKQFLASKHTQPTRRQWRPLRQAYFYKTELEGGKTVEDLRTEYPHIDIDRFLKLINIHKIAKSINYDDAQTTQKVHNERTFPATTLERLYGDKNVRAFLGFEFNNAGDVKIKISKPEFEKGFKKIIQDVVHKNIDSRKLHSEEDRLNYLKSFPKSSIPKLSKGARTLSSKDFREQLPQKTKRKNKLAPNDIAYSLQVPGVERMLHELQDINYHKFPNASHDLLRSFLECALKAYFFQKDVTVKPSQRGGFVTLTNVLRQFKKEMDDSDDKKTKGLSQVTQKIMTDTTMTSYSVQSFNATNHNPFVFPFGDEVKLAWDTMEPLFRYILDPKEPKKQ